MRGMLIAFSGIDGAGKSTQIELVQSYFQESKCPVVYLWTRGGNTPGINWIKMFGRKLSGKKLPPSGHSSQRDQMFGKYWIQKAWLTLAVFDLLWIYSVSIRWQLWRGKIVICDRYLWDTLIDFKIMFPDFGVEKWFLWRLLVWCTPTPDVEYLLMIPIKVSENRCMLKYEPFPDDPERRARRYKLYQKVSILSNWTLLDSTHSVDAVFTKIKHHLPK